MFRTLTSLLRPAIAFLMATQDRHLVIEVDPESAENRDGRTSRPVTLTSRREVTPNRCSPHGAAGRVRDVPPAVAAIGARRRVGCHRVPPRRTTLSGGARGPPS